MERTEQTLTRLAGDAEALQAESEADTKINPTDVLNDMLVFPGVYLRWASILSLAEDQKQQLKDHIEVVEAESDSRWRTIAATGPKMTEAAITAKVATDPAVIAVKEQFNGVSSLVGRLRAVVTALTFKKDLLQSVNSRQCREFVPLNPNR